MNIKQIISESLQNLDESFGNLQILASSLGTKTLKTLLSKTATSQDSKYEIVGDFKSTTGLLNAIKRIQSSANQTVSAIVFVYPNGSTAVCVAPNDVQTLKAGNNIVTYLSTDSDGYSHEYNVTNLARTAEGVYVFFDDYAKIHKKVQRIEGQRLTDPYNPKTPKPYYPTRYDAGITDKDTPFMADAKNKSFGIVRKFTKLEDLAMQVAKGGFSASSDKFYQLNDKFVTKCRLSQDNGGNLLARGRVILVHLVVVDTPESYHPSSKDMVIVLVRSGNTYKMELEPAQ